MNVQGIGIVGAGVVGQLRARTICRNARVRLAGVADVNEPAARATASANKTEHFSDYRRLLDLRGVDAIIISTPGHLHEQIALDAFAAGKHVLCEKPLATTVAGCRGIVAAAAAAGRTLAVGFNHRYYPCIKRLVAVLQSKTIGEIDHVRALAGHSGLAEFRAEWMYKSEFSGGGAMMDIGIHMTDLVSHVAGGICEIVATSSNRVWQVEGSEDNAIALMKTDRGIPVRYQATWSEWKGYRLALEVYGTRGMAGAYFAPMMNLIVTMDPSRQRRRRRIEFHPWVNVRHKIAGWKPTAEIAFAEELDDFLAAIAGEPSRIADGAAGLRAVAVAAAARESSATGRSVTVAV